AKTDAEVRTVAKALRTAVLALDPDDAEEEALTADADAVLAIEGYMKTVRAVLATEEVAAVLPDGTLAAAAEYRSLGKLDARGRVVPGFQLAFWEDWSVSQMREVIARAQSQAAATVARIEPWNLLVDRWQEQCPQAATAGEACDALGLDRNSL